jgi:hypothetical protein
MSKLLFVWPMLFISVTSFAKMKNAANNTEKKIKPTVADGVLKKDCPRSIQILKTQHLPEGKDFCDLWVEQTNLNDDYLVNYGISEDAVSRIANVMGPRFINPTDWEKSSAKDPRTLYKTTGKSDDQAWKSWMKGALFVKERKDKDIGMNFILSLHAATMDNLIKNPGNLRKTQVYGTQTYEAYALSQEEISQMLNNTYSIFSKDYKLNISKLITWEGKFCADHLGGSNSKVDMFSDRVNIQTPLHIENLFGLTAEEKNNLSNKKYDVVTGTFSTTKRTNVQCGMIRYADTALVDSLVKYFIDMINDDLSLIFSEDVSEDKRPDFLEFLSKVQRFYVSIHPFTDGNGRTSRLLMDKFVEQINLLPPILNDHNNDLSSSDKQWAKVIGQGLVRSISEAKKCIGNLATKKSAAKINGCFVIAK